MQLVTYNIRFGLGRDGKYNLKRIAQSVDGADVVALQEVERYWERSGNVDQVAEIASYLPAYYWVYGPAFDMDASARDESGIVLNQRRQFGTMLLSKTPIISSRLLVFGKLASTAFSMELGAVEGLINTKAGPIRFYSLHLSHLRDRERLLQLKELLEQHRNWQYRGGAWTGAGDICSADWSAGQQCPPATPHAILLGDFNSEPGSAPYNLLTGEEHTDMGLVSYMDEFVDSLTINHLGASEHTHQADDPNRDQTKRRLDYCFISADIAHLIESSYVDIKSQGSDHFPYWVTINI